METPQTSKPEPSSSAMESQDDLPTATDKARSRSILRHLVNSRRGIEGVSGEMPKQESRQESREPVRQPPLTIGIRG